MDAVALPGCAAMTLELWQAALLFLTPLLLGAAVLKTIGIRIGDDLWSWPAWAYATGALATAIVIYFLLWMRASLAVIRIAVPIVAMAAYAVAIVLRRRTDDGADPIPRRRLDLSPSTLLKTLVFIAAFAAITYNHVDHALSANEKAIVGGDEASIWASKAKALAAHGGFTAEFGRVAREQVFVAHHDYPLFAPLLQVWTFACAGKITQVDNRWPIQAFVVLMTLFWIGALDRRSRWFVTLPIVILSATAHQLWKQVQTAYVDHITAFAFAMLIDLFWRGQDTNDQRWRRLMMIAAALLIWSKNEGFLLLAAFGGAAAIGAVLRTLNLADLGLTRRVWPWLAVPGLVAALHFFTNRYFGLENDLLVHQDRSLPEMIAAQWDERRLLVLKAFASVYLVYWPTEKFGGAEFDTRALRIGLYQGIPLATFSLMALAPHRAFRKRLLVPTLALIAATVGFYLVYIGSYQEIVWHLYTSSTRVLYLICPAASIWLGRTLGDLFPLFERKSSTVASVDAAP
jgi:hypothetical protein